MSYGACCRDGTADVSGTESKRRITVVGVTGSIASGKSSLISLLASHGYPLIECDKLGHQVYVRFPAVIKQLETLYSMKLTDESGNLDRAKLRGAVFGDDDDSKRRREQLDATVWPRIQDLANEEIAQYCAGKSSCIVLVEAALLLEAAWYTWCDVVVVVTCDDEIRLSRLMERNKIDRDEAYKRLAMSGQLSQGEKLNMLGCTLGIRHDHVYTYSDDNGHDIIIDRRCKPSAAVVMDNSGTSDQLRNRAELLMKDLITEIERND